jgi:hypothetical protein
MEPSYRVSGVVGDAGLGRGTNSELLLGLYTCNEEAIYKVACDVYFPWDCKSRRPRVLTLRLVTAFVVSQKADTTQKAVMSVIVVLGDVTH